MENFLKFIIFLILSSSYFSKNLKQHTTNAEDKLLFVWEHFRHGARGPYAGVNPKNFKDFIGEKWDGVGEITSLGMRMHYLLGVSSKRKYSSFLSKTYNPKELFIKSTNVNRTLISVYSFLKGLYGNETSINMTEKQIERSNILNSNYSSKIESKIEELENKYNLNKN